jgi:hypothetical protein
VPEFGGGVGGVVLDGSGAGGGERVGGAGEQAQGVAVDEDPAGGWVAAEGEVLAVEGGGEGVEFTGVGGELDDVVSPLLGVRRRLTFPGWVDGQGWPGSVGPVISSPLCSTEFSYSPGASAPDELRARCPIPLTRLPSPPPGGGGLFVFHTVVFASTSSRPEADHR